MVVILPARSVNTFFLFFVFLIGLIFFGVVNNDLVASFCIVTTEKHFARVCTLTLKGTLHFNTNLKVARNIVNDFYFRKWALFLRYPSGIKTLPFDPIFLSWVHVIKVVPIIKYSKNSKSLKVIYFFIEIRKLRFFQESQWFFCLLAFITLFQSSIGCFEIFGFWPNLGFGLKNLNLFEWIFLSFFLLILRNQKLKEFLKISAKSFQKVFFFENSVFTVAISNGN